MEPISLRIQFFDYQGAAYEDPKNVIMMPGDTLTIQSEINGRIFTVATITPVPIDYPSLGSPIFSGFLPETPKPDIEKFPLWNSNDG